MKEKIVSIITDYLNREETDYALMINGVWGSGKTFFIKNTLKKDIEKINKIAKNCYILCCIFHIILPRFL